MADFKAGAVALAPSGSTGNARFYARNFERTHAIAVEFVVEAVGATPTVSFTIQGLKAGGDPAVATDWADVAYVDGDATVASSKAAIVVIAPGRTVKFIDGMDLRFFEAIAVTTTANTNVTFRANAYPRNGRGA